MSSILSRGNKAILFELTSLLSRAREYSTRAQISDLLIDRGAVRKARQNLTTSLVCYSRASALYGARGNPRIRDPSRDRKGGPFGRAQGRLSRCKPTWPHLADLAARSRMVEFFGLASPLRGDFVNCSVAVCTSPAVQRRAVKRTALSEQEARAGIGAVIDGDAERVQNGLGPGVA